MGQYSALSDDFIIIAVSKAIVNSKTEKVEKYRRKSRAFIGAYFLILVSRALTLGKGEGQPENAAFFMNKKKKPAETFVSTGSVERPTRLELATSTLARWRSTR